MCLKQNRLQLGDSQESKRYTFRRCGVRAVIALGVTSAGVRGSDDLISANCVFPGKETRPCPHHYQAPHSQYPGLFPLFLTLPLHGRAAVCTHAHHSTHTRNTLFRATITVFCAASGQADFDARLLRSKNTVHFSVGCYY